MHKNTLIAVLAALLLFSGSLFNPAAALVTDDTTVVHSPFSDLPDGDEAAEAFALLWALDIFQGYGDGRVGPTDTLTRAQFAKIAVTLAGHEKLAQTLQARQPRFSDTDTFPTWSHGWINAAYDLGMVVGREDGSFDPNAPVTYAEAVTMLLRGLGYGGFINPWPEAALQKADELEITQDLPRDFQTTPQVVLSRRRMALITARSLGVHPPSGAEPGEPDEDAESRREQLALTGILEVAGADHIVLGEETFDLAPVVALFGGNTLQELVGVRVEAFRNAEDEIAYITADSRFRVEDVFAEWTEDGYILLEDGRALVPVSDEELLVAINGGEARQKGDDDFRNYEDVQSLLTEGDDLRLTLDEEGRVERVDAYRDTHVDLVLTGITPSYSEERAGQVNLLDSAGNGYNYLVTDRTEVTVDGELVGISRIEEEIYDNLNAHVIASVRAADDDEEGGLDVHLHTLRVIADNVVEGSITHLDEDEDGEYVIINGLRYYYDPGHLEGGPGGDFDTGDYVRFLLGSDDVARVMLLGPSGVN
ncbi:MAG: S-layer homology domain-containing protein [Clostridia bacterium]